MPGVEQASSHPLAKAVVQAASSRGHRIPQIQDGTFEQEPGSGASATIDGRRIAVGSLDWVERQVSNSQASVSQNPAEPTSASEPHNPAQPTMNAAKSQGLDAKRPGLGRLSELAGQGQTVIYVSIDGQVAGAVAMADEVRSDAADTVEGLRRLGLQTAMVSGDKQAAAEAVAKKVGIDEQQVHPRRFSVQSNMFPTWLRSLVGQWFLIMLADHRCTEQFSHPEFTSINCCTEARILQQ